MMVSYAIADINALSSYSLLVTAGLMLVATSLIQVPYGRYSTHGWGFLINCRLAWFLMESPNLWISLLVYVLSQRLSDTTAAHSFPLPNKILICLFVFHYVNRSLIFPLRMCAGNPMPISVMMSAFIFCIWNAFNQATYLLVVYRYDDSWLYDIRFIGGLVLFVYGFIVNNHADSILISLRKRKIEESSGEQKHHYYIPVGSMFEYVSCSNYCKCHIRY